MRTVHVLFGHLYRSKLGLRMNLKTIIVLMYPSNEVGRVAVITEIYLNDYKQQSDIELCVSVA